MRRAPGLSNALAAGRLTALLAVLPLHQRGRTCTKPSPTPCPTHRRKTTPAARLSQPAASRRQPPGRLPLHGWRISLHGWRRDSCFIFTCSPNNNTRPPQPPHNCTQSDRPGGLLPGFAFARLRGCRRTTSRRLRIRRPAQRLRQKPQSVTAPQRTRDLQQLHVAAPGCWISSLFRKPRTFPGAPVSSWSCRPPFSAHHHTSCSHRMSQR